MHGLFLSNIKKVLQKTNAFQEVLNESGRKASKIWVDKNSEFYNRSMESWLQDNDIDIEK